MSNETFLREIGRILAGGYYDLQGIRLGIMNRLREVIRLKNEGLDASTREKKKEPDEKALGEEYSDKKLPELLTEMKATGKLNDKEYGYVIRLQTLLKLAKNLEKEYLSFMNEYISGEAIWTQWLSGVKGISTVLCANLLKEVGYCDGIYTEDVLDDEGEILHRKGDERTPSISSLWRYFGLDVVDGKAPKRRRGEKIGYKPRLRTLAWKITDSFVKQRTPYYRDVYDKEKERQLRLMEEKAENAPERPLHAELRARRKTAKLFLSHFWFVARTLKYLSTEPPYVEARLGHKHIIMPEFDEEEGIYKIKR